MSGRPSTQVHGRHKETPHYTSTDDRSVCSHQQDIDCDTCNCEPVGPAFAEEPPQGQGEKSGEDGDIRATDHDNVTRACSVIVVVQIGRDPRFDAQENAL